MLHVDLSSRQTGKTSRMIENVRQTKKPVIVIVDHMINKKMVRDKLRTETIVVHTTHQLEVALARHGLSTYSDINAIADKVTLYYDDVDYTKVKVLHSDEFHYSATDIDLLRARHPELAVG